ncbi:substrate-binding domain-containing protein [Endozoicomonas arenosclerae]|uniref:LacI family DNA-binding transcriptional regulator n=1 Tax=Endozoicomonas arenosclerae TaxID=1633495 RepID=UPI0007825A5A|nr:LacI family DNA-binding transcriptional regulator [Endozoicomonas arenosclerae]
MKLEDLARLAGVSKSTASIILNGHAERYRISEKTCEKVLELAREHHYVANAQAAGLRSRNSKLLALILPDLMHHGFAELSKHLEQLARKAGYQLIISCSDDEPEMEEKLVRTLTGRKVEAIISVSTVTDYRVYHQAEKRGIPVILLDRFQSGAALDSIISDDRKAAKELTRVMLTGRPGAIAYFGGNQALDNCRLRFQGFSEALEESGEAENIATVHHLDYSVEAGYSMMKDYFRQHQSLPEKLFTGSFTLMEGVLQFTRKHLDKMPEQIDWATFGDSYILDLLPFTIHSARQQYEEMAKQAMGSLDAKFNKREYQSQIVLDREIICRLI